MTKGSGSKLKKNNALNKILSRPSYAEPTVLSEEKVKAEQTIDNAKKESVETCASNLNERERLNSFRRPLFTPLKAIGTQEDIVPFAWQNPPSYHKLKRPSKYLKNLQLQKERAKKEREKKLLESQNPT